METTTQTSNKFYPGMVNSAVEIFKKYDDLKFIAEGRVMSYQNAPFAIISIIDEAINEVENAKQILEEWHPNSPMKQNKQFAWCRFGGLDYSADIIDGVLQDGEYHECPKRGKCVGEGLLCKLPIYKGTRLTVQMVQLMKLLCTTDTNTVIAEKMNLPDGSYHLLKKKLYAALGGIQTKQEVALIARHLNIV